MPFVGVPGATVLFAVKETRVSDWQAFVAQANYQWDYKPHFDQGPDHPAVGISLQDARAFCSWLTEKERQDKRITADQTYRLPTNEEWDAAIGLLRTRKADLTVDEKVTDERTFPWGLRWPPPAKSGNFAEQEIPGYEDGFPFTAPGGQFTATAEGIFDLTGNVWEWCWDMQVRAEENGVLRGGSWAYFRPECLTSAYRYVVPADLRMPTIGFRCVFQDKQRTAVLLVAAEEQKAKARAQRREELLGGAVDKEELAAMRKKLAGSGASSNLPDPSTLTPVAAGKPFQNVLGMEFVPLGDGKLLMGKTEVRVQDFEAWLKVTGRSWDKKPTFLLGATLPASGLTWEDAQAFCEWLTERDRASKLIPADATYRLPSDVEWSLAAGLTDEPGADPAARHGSKPGHYPWSAEGAFPPPGGSVNLDASKIKGYSDSYSYTAPVDTEAPNATGIHGLGGNVSEWCADPWPGSTDERVIRGGSYLSADRELLQTAARLRASKEASRSDVGFRVVLALSGS